MSKRGNLTPSLLSFQKRVPSAVNRISKAPVRPLLHPPWKEGEGGTICTVVCRNSGGLHLERLISSLEQERLTPPPRGLVVRAPGPAVVKLAVSLVYRLGPTRRFSFIRGAVGRRRKPRKFHSRRGK